MQERKRGTGMARVTLNEQEYEITDELAQALVHSGSARTRTISAKVSDATYVAALQLAVSRGVTLSTLVSESLEKEIGND